MISQRQLFLQNLAQTSPTPLMIEVERAEGSWIYDVKGKKYLDLISGISVSSLGHRHPKVIEAIQQQLEKYLHVMVYGEFVQSPQVQLAHRLTEFLPVSLNAVYFTNSGTEATEGAMKLAKRITGRSGVVSFAGAYHGSTQGALSIAGGTNFQQKYRPLIPGCTMIEYNQEQQLQEITRDTACVFAEIVRGEAGALVPQPEFLHQLRKRCDETGALLVVDEIQTGMGRTGKLFAFEHEGIVPDILLLGKAFGGGMPLGAFIASREMMAALSENPVLGHITTFGGHPVCCAAGLAALEVLTGSDNLIPQIAEKEQVFRQRLRHPLIEKVTGKGLLLAVHLASFEQVQLVISKCYERGVITDWFLFNDRAIRLAPPLTITLDEIEFACNVLLEGLEAVE
ncbi:MAG: aspartate aminotransferase family protein [Bacteroidia bacterium]